jgi:hypothetical protein
VKRLPMILMIMMVLLIVIVATLDAKPAMYRDANGFPMQFSKTFTVEKDSCNAITLHKATVPTNCIEAILIVKTAPIYICPDSTTAVTDDIEIPAGVAVRVPVLSMTKFYYRSVTATASILNIIWCKD